MTYDFKHSPPLGGTNVQKINTQNIWYLLKYPVNQMEIHPWFKHRPYSTQDARNCNCSVADSREIFWRIGRKTVHARPRVQWRDLTILLRGNTVVPKFSVTGLWGHYEKDNFSRFKFTSKVWSRNYGHIIRERTLNFRHLTVCLFSRKTRNTCFALLRK